MTNEEMDDLRSKNDESIEIISKDHKFLDKPNYYSQIPASVRYDKKLNYIEKFLYGEIIALTNIEGFCYAQNKYFADLIERSERTVSKWINHLAELGYIFLTFEINNGREYRKIYITKELAESSGWKKASTIGRRKLLQSTTVLSTKYDSTISTKYNSTNYSKYSSTVSTAPSEASRVESKKAKPEDEDKVKLPLWLGTNTHARLATIYERLWTRQFNAPHKVSLGGQGGGIFKSLMKDYSEPMVGLMLIVHFEWKGIEGDQQYFLDGLRKAGFPLSWIPTRAPAYFAFIQNHLKITTDEEALKKVEIALKKLLEEEK